MEEESQNNGKDRRRQILKTNCFFNQKLEEQLKNEKKNSINKKNKKYMFYLFQYEIQIRNSFFLEAVIEYLLISYSNQQMESRSFQLFIDYFNNFILSIQIQSFRSSLLHLQNILVQQKYDISIQNTSQYYHLLQELAAFILKDNNRYNNNIQFQNEVNYKLVEIILKKLEIPNVLYLFGNDQKIKFKSEYETNIQRDDQKIIIVLDNRNNHIYFFDSQVQQEEIVSVINKDILWNLKTMSNQCINQTIQYSQSEIFYFKDSWMETILYKVVIEFHLILLNNKSHKNQIISIYKIIANNLNNLCMYSQDQKFSSDDKTQIQDYLNVVLNGKQYYVKSIDLISNKLIKILFEYLIQSQIKKFIYQNQINYQLARDLCHKIGSIFGIDIFVRNLKYFKPIEESISEQKVQMILLYFNQKIVFYQKDIQNQILLYNKMNIQENEFINVECENLKSEICNQCQFHSANIFIIDPPLCTFCFRNIVQNSF